MKFGNLDGVLDGDKTIYQVVNEAMDNSIEKKPSKVGRFLKVISRYGMAYDEDVYRNMKALPSDSHLLSDDEAMMQRYYNVSSLKYKESGEEEKPFKEKNLDAKRQKLRQLATAPELEEIIDTMCNESIVYDEDMVYICQPFINQSVVQLFNEQYIEKIQNSIDAAFYKIYYLADWKKKAWDLYKRYMIDGVLAYEIVYDDLENPRTIIGLVELDPATLTEENENGIRFWTQFKGVNGYERRLTDAQIIYIKYEDSGVIDRQSYVERLIRPYNIYRIIEQAQIIWTVTQSSFKTMFTIPVGGMNRTKGMQTLNMTMNRYREDISFNGETGEIRVNGKTNLPFNKEYWLPENENGSPTIETLTDNGPDLANSEQLKFYLSKLYKMSKIPETRFDKEAAQTWFGSDPTQQLRDEINYSRFVTRCRNNFAEIVLKPVRILVAMNIPEIKEDKRVLDAIGLRFNSYNQFEEMMEMEIDSKRIDFISNMSQNLVTIDGEGNEKPYFSMKFLIMRYLKMSESDLELNEKYKFEEQIAAGNAENDEEGGGEDTEMDDLMGGGNEEGGGPGEEQEEGGLDKEMMGDVKPESPETTQA